MIPMQMLPLTEAVYTFVDDTGEATHIAATTLLRFLEHVGWPVGRCMIAEGLAAALERGDLGVEPPHALRLPEAALEAPGIIGEWGDRHISIDGAHRLWRRWQRGDAGFPAYVVPEDVWREFTIYGMPGSGELWRELNKMEVRTPEMEALVRARRRVMEAFKSIYPGVWTLRRLDPIERTVRYEWRETEDSPRVRYFHPFHATLQEWERASD